MQVGQVQDPSAPVDPNFDPMYNRFRYGNTFVKGSSVAQQVQDPSAPVDPNFDPMYNRFRYGNTFVKGSSLNEVTPDHPKFTADQTAGANADGTLPRFGTAYVSGKK